jgi:endonuclease III
MPTVKIPYVLHSNERRSLLDMLEKIGSRNIAEDLKKTLLDILSHELLNNKEFLVRYFLLAAILDQQAESESARQTVKRVFQNYGYEFFMKPQRYFNNIHEIVRCVLDTYTPKTRIIRMKKEGITFLRIGGFMLAIHNLSYRFGGLIEYFKRYQDTFILLNKGILEEHSLSGLFYEKAARLYVGWITHPKLFVKIYGENLPVNFIPMVVNGHVVKILARTGFLESVHVERERMIVEAEKERLRIEKEVRTIKSDGDMFSIDYGAFLIGTKYCHEENPDCNRCPLNTICLKNVMFRAY